MTAPSAAFDPAPSAPDCRPEGRSDGREHPPLRLVVVPTPQPPLADPTEPVRLVIPGVRPPRPLHRPGPRPGAAEHARAVHVDFRPAWSGRTELPDPGQAGRRLLTTALEALAGRRPVAQLRPLTTPGVFTALAGRHRPRWCAEGNAPFALGAVRVCEPVDGIAEVSALVRRSGRAHAVAARLEGIDGRWQCTALQIG